MRYYFKEAEKYGDVVKYKTFYSDLEIFRDSYMCICDNKTDFTHIDILDTVIKEGKYHSYAWAIKLISEDEYMLEQVQ